MEVRGKYEEEEEEDLFERGVEWPEEEEEVGAREDVEYNDANFWKLDLGKNYDLVAMMRDM